MQLVHARSERLALNKRCGEPDALYLQPVIALRGGCRPGESDPFCRLTRRRDHLAGRARIPFTGTPPPSFRRDPATPCTLLIQSIVTTLTQPAKPLDILRQQITTLEAAITLALAGPREKTVHLLRTSTRRIEAQLALLDLLARSSDTGHLKKVTRLLGQLRRAAGRVRALDVARDLLQDPRALQTAAPAQSLDESLGHTASLYRHLERDCKSLRRSLRHKRSAAAADLVTLLHRHGPALAHALEDLLDSLAAPEETHSLSISPARLSTLTEDWVRTHLPSAPDPGASTEDLHGFRKIAKLARYMAESTPATASLAHTFEKLQHAGGTWHDFLFLHDLARHELGKHSPLTELLSRLTTSTLAAFQAKLAAAPGSGDGHRKDDAV